MSKVALENCQLMYKNFSGMKGLYNDEGDRNFAIFLTPEQAEKLEEVGVIVKALKIREEGDIPQPFVKVKVNFTYPPMIYLIKKGGSNLLTEDKVSILDGADIARADLILNVSKPWTVQGVTGRTLYLKNAYITLEVNEFEERYADALQMEGAQTCVGPNCPVDEE